MAHRKSGNEEIAELEASLRETDIRIAFAEGLVKEFYHDLESARGMYRPPDVQRRYHCVAGIAGARQEMMYWKEERQRLEAELSRKQRS